MKNLLLSERWRPKNLEDIILLPRIRKIFENGLEQNVILYGSFGTGKTTLARILIGKYSKDRPYIELNSSFYTSIDTLRSKIDDFCSKVYMGFDLESEISSDSMKYVFLDEFERTSTQYQDALKAYIEDFSTKNVRFILTTNHINKVSDGILSRLTKINFDCQNPEEEKYLKTEMYKRIVNVISVKENFEIPKEDLIRIINKKFPDFRAVMVELEHFIQTGMSTPSSSAVNLKLRNDLYDMVFDKSKTYEEIYHFLMDSFGAEKIDEMIGLLGRPFVDYVISERREKDFDKLFRTNYIISEHTRLLETNTDPIVLGMTVIGKFRDLY
jgi:replication-associated recombination protein RarA